MGHDNSVFLSALLLELGVLLEAKFLRVLDIRCLLNGLEVS